MQTRTLAVSHAQSGATGSATTGGTPCASSCSDLPLRVTGTVARRRSSCLRVGTQPHPLPPRFPQMLLTHFEACRRVVYIVRGCLHVRCVLLVCGAHALICWRASSWCRCQCQWAAAGDSALPSDSGCSRPCTPTPTPTPTGRVLLVAEVCQVHCSTPAAHDTDEVLPIFHVQECDLQS